MNSNDVITGGTGADVLYGEDGDDQIYATDAAAAADAQIATILTANPSVSYNESTGNFYQFVTAGVSWTAANTAANAATLDGANGHLAVISSAEENDFITTISGATFSWIGGSDATTEGEWFWVTGPENGTQFHTGGSGGGPVGGLYSNWTPGDPSNSTASWDYTVHLNDGTWWADDAAFTGYDGYIIEWEGDAVLGTTGTNTLSGGAGLDTLYGDDGTQDIFVFEAASAYANLDQINRFTAADGDAIDISDLLTGFTAGVSDINDFVRFTNSGGNSLIQVDGDGTVGGVSFSNVGQINGVNDLDTDALFYNQSIIA